MKKYIISAVALFTMLITSCSNDDITISRSTTIKVNPYGVISGFPEEFPGELTSFDQVYKLRVRVLAYDKDGVLAFSDSSFVNNYQTETSMPTSLPTGTYTIIATTDIVSYSDGKVTDEAWNISEKNNINNVILRARRNSSVFGGKYNILGIGSKVQTISEGTQSIELNPTPAGALLRIYYYNVLAYNNVKYYYLLSNRGCNFVTFDSNGIPRLIPENNNNEFDFLCSYTDVEYARSKGWDATYGWAFMFPVDNVGFQFKWEDKEENDHDMGDSFTVPSMQIGEEWIISVDCKTDEIDYSKYTSTSTRSQTNESVPCFLNQNEKKNTTMDFSSLNSNSRSKKLKDLIKK